MPKRPFLLWWILSSRRILLLYLCCLIVLPLVYFIVYIWAHFFSILAKVLVFLLHFKVRIVPLLAILGDGLRSRSGLVSPIPYH